MFSARTGVPLQENRIALKLRALRQAHIALLDLTESNPTRVGLAPGSAQIAAALTDGDLGQYDPDPRGLRSAREAVAAYYQERGLEVLPEQILVCSSTSEAYGWLLTLLADPGDTVLVPAPSYPLLDLLARFESVLLHPYPLLYDATWSIDLEALRRACDGQARAIVLVHPNNPTGSFLKRRELDCLRQLGLPVISDEVFADYPASPDPERAPSLVNELELLTFCLSGLSKVAGLPQLKASWIVLAGPPALRQEAIARLELIADTTLSVGPVQLGLSRLLALRHDFQSALRQRLAANRQLLAATFAGSATTVLHSEGGWQAVLRVPRIRSEEEWVLFLAEQEQVLVHPGYFYDFAHEAFLVLSLLPAPEVFGAGLERLARHLR